METKTQNKPKTLTQKVELIEQQNEALLLVISELVTVVNYLCQQNGSDIDSDLRVALEKNQMDSQKEN